MKRYIKSVSLSLTQGYSKDELITAVNAFATKLARKGNIDYDEIIAYLRDAERWLADADEGDSYFMAGKSFLYNPERDCDEYVECATESSKPRYFANMVSCATEDAVYNRSLPLFEQYRLDEFYNADDNVAIIPDDHFADSRLWKWITRFLVNNETWNMCHQDWGKDSGCWVIYET